jgi:TP901 family phage tail tape measure protein
MAKTPNTSEMEIVVGVDTPVTTDLMQEQLNEIAKKIKIKVNAELSQNALKGIQESVSKATKNVQVSITPTTNQQTITRNIQQAVSTASKTIASNPITVPVKGTLISSSSTFLQGELSSQDLKYINSKTQTTTTDMYRLDDVGKLYLSGQKVVENYKQQQKAVETLSQKIDTYTKKIEELKSKNASLIAGSRELQQIVSKLNTYPAQLQSEEGLALRVKRYEELQRGIAKIKNTQANNSNIANQEKAITQLTSKYATLQQTLQSTTKVSVTRGEQSAVDKLNAKIQAIGKSLAVVESETKNRHLVDISTLKSDIEIAEREITRYKTLVEQINSTVTPVALGLNATGKKVLESNPNLKASFDSAFKRYQNLTSNPTASFATTDIQKLISDFQKLKTSLQGGYDDIFNSKDIGSISSVYDKLEEAMKKYSSAKQNQLSLSAKNKASIDSEIQKYDTLIQTYERVIQTQGQIPAREERLSSLRQTLTANRDEAVNRNRNNALSVISQMSRGTSMFLNDKAVNKYSTLPEVQQLKQQFSDIRVEYENLRNQLQSGSLSADGLIQINNQLLQLRERFLSVSSAGETLKTKLRASSETFIDLQYKIQQAQFAIQKLEQNTNWGFVKEYGSRISQLKTQLSLMSPETSSLAEIEQLQRNIKILTKEAQLAGVTGKGTITKIKNALSKFTRWFGVSWVVTTIVSQVREAIVQLKEVDTLLTEISKTSERSAESLLELGKKSFSEANKYGATITGYLEGVREMSRAGFGEGQSEELGRLSLLAQSAGDMTADLANQYLIATNFAYGLGGSVEKLNAILDAQNQITNRNAVNMTEFAEATKIAGNQLANSNIDIQQSSALLATGLITTQQGGQEVGRAIKGIIMNLQSVSGETGDGDVLNEESFAKAEKRLASVGVAMETVENGATHLRSAISILKDLAEVYNSLPEDSPERAGIIEDLGGKFRGNVLSSILSNWDTYEKVLKDYENANGSAQTEADKTANSWQGVLNQLSNTWIEFINNFVTAKGMTTFIKNLQSALDTVNGLVDGFGKIPSLIATIGAVNTFGGKGVFGYNKDTGFKTLFGIDAENGYRGIFKDIKSLFSSQAVSQVDILGESQVLPILSRYTDEGRQASQNFLNSLNDDTLRRYIQSLDGANASYQDYTVFAQQAQAQQAQLNNVLSAGRARLTAIRNSIGSTILNMGVTAAISLAVFWIQQLITLQERERKQTLELAQATRDKGEAYETEIEKIRELQSEYQKLNSISIGAEALKTKLDELQSSFAEEGISDPEINSILDKIDLENGLYSEQISLINQLIQKKSELYTNENKVTYNKAQEKLLNDRQTNVGWSAMSGVINSKAQKAINEYIQKNNNGEIFYKYYNTANASGRQLKSYGSLEKRIADFKEYLKIIDEYDPDAVDKRFYKKIQEELSSMEEEFSLFSTVVDKYKSALSEIQNMDFYSDYEQDVQRFADITSQLENETDTDKIKAYVQQLQELKKAMLNSVATDNLDVSAIKSQADNIDEMFSNILDKYKVNVKTFSEAVASVKLIPDDYQDDISNYEKSIKTLSSAYDEMAKDKVLSSSTMKDLISDGFAGAIDFDSQLQGYTLITDKAKELLKTKYETVQANMSARESTLADTYNAEIKAIDEEISKAKELNDLNKVADLNKQKSSLTSEYQEALRYANSFSALNTDLNTSISKYLNNENAEIINSTELLKTAFENLESAYSLLDTAQTEIASGTSLSSSTLKSIVETFPNLSGEVAKYQSGNLSENILVDKLKSAYLSSVDVYRQSLSLKYESDTSFYQELLANNAEYVSLLSDRYNIDLTNYRTVAEAKLAIEKNIIAQTKSAWQDYYSVDIDQSTGRARVNTKGNLSINSAEDYKNFSGSLREQAYNSALQAVEDINKIFEKAKVNVKISPDLFDIDNNSLETYNAIKARYEKDLSALEHSYSLGEINVEAYYAKLAELNNKYLKGNTQFIEDYNSNIEKLHSGISEIFEDKRKDLDHQLAMDYISEDTYYERLMALANEYYGGKVEWLREYQSVEEEYYKHSIQSQEEYYKKQIDALEEINNQQQSLIDLMKARIALENAYRNKTVNTYSSERGWNYEADQSAIQDALSDYQSKYISFTKSQLEIAEKAKDPDNNLDLVPLSDSQLEAMWGTSMDMIKNSMLTSWTQSMNDFNTSYGNNNYYNTNSTNNPVFNLSIGTVMANNPEDFASNFDTYLNNFLAQANLLSRNR